MDQHTESPQGAKSIDDFLAAEDTTTDQQITHYKIFANGQQVYEGDDWYEAFLIFFSAHKLLGAHQVVRWENGLPYCMLCYFSE